MDYIFFFYGLAFLVLATVCFSLDRTKMHRIPWLWLGMFGLVHGLQEWLDLACFVWASNKVIPVIRAVALVISYLFLFEFARRGFKLIYNRRPGVWIYIPFLLLIAFFNGHSLESLNVVTRYALALPSGVSAFWIIYKFFKAETHPRLRRLLLVLSLSLGLYSVLAGLIVPEAAFPPACWINYNSFLKIFGFPVQFLRGISAIVCAMAIWAYSEEYRLFISKEQRYPARLQLSTWLMFILIALIGCGWVLVNYLGAQSKDRLITDTRIDVSDLSHTLLAELTKIEQAAMTISGSPWIAPALVTADLQNIRNANAVLTRYRRSLGMSECFLLDLKGTAIASSNWNTPDSFIGASFGRLAYFKQSLKGELGSYFGFDPVSRERCYYSSFPVRNEEDMIIGVVAMKRSIEILEEEFRSQSRCFLADPFGIIFLSSDREYIFHSIWPVNKALERRIVDSGQFGKTPFAALLSREVLDGDRIAFQKSDFFVIRAPIGREGWSMVRFVSTGPILQYRLYGISLILFLSIMVMVLFVAVKQRENLLALISTVNTQLKTVLDAATHVSIIATELHGLISVFNTGAERMLGYPAEEMVEMHTPEILHLESELIAYGKRLSEELHHPVAGFDVLVAHAREGRYDEKEWTYVRRDGRKITVSLSVTAQRDAKGELIGFLFIATDITERKKIEEALRYSDERFKQVAESAGEWIWEVDRFGLYTYSSPVIKNILGFEAQEIVGKKYFYDFVPLDEKEALRKEMRDIFSKREPFTKLAHPHLHRNGDQVIMESTGIPLLDEEGILLGYRGVDTDITERKRAEEALARQAQELARSNTELERFAYVASHDLQEPLRMVSSYVQLLEKRYKGKLDADADDFIAYAVDGVNWMQTLINGLLAYSRVGTQGKKFEATDLNSVIIRVLMNLRIAIEETGAVVTAIPCPPLRPTAHSWNACSRTLSAMP